MWNLLPWQGQSMVPFLICESAHPACVQIAEKPLKVPFDGCVTTTFSSAKILPPPTGISAVSASVVPPALLPVPDDCALLPEGVPADGEDSGVGDDVVEPEPEPPQAASAATRPAVPVAATTVRLVVCAVES